MTLFLSFSTSFLFKFILIYKVILHDIRIFVCLPKITTSVDLSVYRLPFEIMIAIDGLAVRAARVGAQWLRDDTAAYVKQAE